MNNDFASKAWFAGALVVSQDQVLLKKEKTRDVYHIPAVTCLEAEDPQGTVVRYAAEELDYASDPEDWNHFAFLSAPSYIFHYFRMNIKRMAQLNDRGSMYWHRIADLSSSGIDPKALWLIYAALDPKVKGAVMGKIL